MSLSFRKCNSLVKIIFKEYHTDLSSKSKKAKEPPKSKKEKEPEKKEKPQTTDKTFMRKKLAIFEGEDRPKTNDLPRYALRANSRVSPGLFMNFKPKQSIHYNDATGMD